MDKWTNGHKKIKKIERRTTKSREEQTQKIDKGSTKGKTYRGIDETDKQKKKKKYLEPGTLYHKEQISTHTNVFN